MTVRTPYGEIIHEINTRSARLSRQSNKGGRTFVDYVRIYRGLVIFIPLLFGAALVLRGGL